jgi:hypothetical protein
MTTNGTALAPREQANIIESVIAAGDLSKLTPAQRTTYYLERCRSIGLNEMTQPFEYLHLNGKLILYANKGCTDQLRDIKDVSITRVDKEIVGDIYIATAYAQRGDRQDSEIGAVNVTGLRGVDLANAMMKAVTKAKRRVTLSICGLGMLDESEVETIPNAQTVVVDGTTGEVLETRPARPEMVDDQDSRFAEWLQLASEAANLKIIKVPSLMPPVELTTLRLEYGKLRKAIKQAKEAAASPSQDAAELSRVSEIVPTVSDARDSEPVFTDALVTDKNHPLWKRWLSAEAAARKAELGIDTSGVKLGKVTEIALDASCADLESMVYEAKSDSEVAF